MLLADLLLFAEDRFLEKMLKDFLALGETEMEPNLRPANKRSLGGAEVGGEGVAALVVGAMEWRAGDGEEDWLTPA